MGLAGATLWPNRIPRLGHPIPDYANPSSLRMRPVMRDLALERGGRPPKFGVPDFAGTACRAANGGGDAAPKSQQRAVILGRNAVRRESGKMHRAPEAVTCRSEIMARLCRLSSWI